jgi:hypothetical protein
MLHTNALDKDLQSRLDAAGGEPLDGSGFEREEPEAGFAAAELGEEQ